MTIFSEVLIFAAFWLFAVLSTLFYMHMFQLNSYRADDQWHWMLKNRGKVVPLALPLIGAIIGVICGKNAGMKRWRERSFCVWRGFSAAICVKSLNMQESQQRI